MKEPDKYKEIKEELTAIYHENKGRYGYRRMTMELHNRGFCINHKTVLKLMKELGLQCFIRVQKYKSYKSEVGKICDNLLNREVDMLEKAFTKIPNGTNLILHSDQGWQYQIKQYQHLLKEKAFDRVYRLLQ